MSIFERFDTWIGKTLFVPLIIRFCQRCGWSQHRFHRVCWFAALLVALYFAQSWGVKLLFGVFATLACLSAAVLPDDYEETSIGRWFRMLTLFTVLITLPWPNWTIGYSLLILFAEYASTIRTIPPLEVKQPKTKRAPARAGA